MDTVLVEEERGQESPESPDNTILNDQATPLGEDQAPEEGDHPLRHPKRDISELRNPLPFVLHMRQTLFELKDPVDLKQQEFDLYWPYIDNVWVRQHKSSVDKAGRSNYIDYYACRLQRATYAPKRNTESRPEGQPQRKKKTRPGGTCQVRAKVTRHQGQFNKLTISRIGEHEHTHDLEHLDKIKRNSAVMDIARSEVMKGYMPASVYTVMHEEPGKLAVIGGKYINRNDVRNASQHWRQAFKGELGVHPGYKYDLGTGILTVPANAGNTSQATLPAPVHPSLHPIPHDTLYFPPAMSTFLAPYLPPRDTIPRGSLPHVTLTYATSMDSFLAFSPATPTPISGLMTKAMTHYLRSCHDAIMIGVGTVIADDPTLNCRLAGSGGFGGLGWQNHPKPYIIDPSSRWQLSEQSRVLKAVREGRGRAPDIIVGPGFTVDETRIETLKAHGGKYLGLPDFDDRYRLSWESIFRALAESGIRSVMVEGGATIINELLRPENVRLVSNAIVTVAPTYFGTGGVSVCPPRRIDSQGNPLPAVRFRDVRWQGLGEDVVMCGRLNDAPVTPGSAISNTIDTMPGAMAGHLPVPAQRSQNAVPMRADSTGQEQSQSSMAPARADSVINQLEQAAGFGSSNG
ncbi:2,5-diamino-6-(ribosylamino)-4(3H)-pyrimidinone 5'-phosphate reductase [Thelotrema lepadinum]|nr:2,5-diamino-6-(ribosylamino)-4(3H)-pyrimidinone 5'-phosphate reductase [Thelotrema lepadinum]